MTDTDKSEPLKARIKIGAGIGQDHRFGKWPTCLAPNGKDEADDPDMVFEARECGGNLIELRAFGFGLLDVKGGYGNGSIHVWSVEDLIVENKVRVMLAKRKRKALEAQRAELSQQITKLDDEMAKLDAWCAA